MKEQQSFSDIEYGMRKRTTKREEFLDVMDEVICWDEWCAYIEPYYYKGEHGRPPMGIEKMLRMYLLQVWFNLSDEGIEDAIYDSYAFRKFMKINFVEEQVPDATTLLKFRRILEKNAIGEKMFNAIRDCFDKAGVTVRGGSIVDATLISAASSTKNEEKERDPEMHQTKKGNQYYFGMKVHIAADPINGMVHSLVTTPANVHDIEEVHEIIRPDDRVVYGDSGYLGIQKRPEIVNDPEFSKIDFRINRRPSQLKITNKYSGFDWDKYIEYRKSSVRCKVEHAFLIVKRDFGYRKAIYKGLAKNTNRLYFLFACANIVMFIRAGNRKMPALG